MSLFLFPGLLQYLDVYSVQMGHSWKAWNMVVMYAYYLFFLVLAFVFQKYVTFDATHNPHIETTEDRAVRRKILAEKGEPALKELATRFGKLQQQMNMGQMPGVIPDPRTVIEEIFLEMLKPGFNEAQLARYGDEITKRKENLKTIAVSNLVARLDQDLILTVEQREKITAELTANWKDNWCQSLDYIQYFDRYFPDIPDRFVSSHLDDMQKVLYHKIPKNQRIFLGIGNPRQIQIAESAFQEEDSDVKPPSPNAAR